MSKRLLLKNKIIRFYEEDIWGIFYKKQQKRDFFLRKLKYLLFLNKTVDKIKNFYYFRRRFYFITKKYLSISLRKVRKWRGKRFKKRNYKFWFKFYYYTKKGIRRYSWLRKKKIKNNLKKKEKKNKIIKPLIWPIKLKNKKIRQILNPKLRKRNDNKEGKYIYIFNNKRYFTKKKVLKAKFKYKLKLCLKSSNYRLRNKHLFYFFFYFFKHKKFIYIKGILNVFKRNIFFFLILIF